MICERISRAVLPLILLLLFFNIHLSIARKDEDTDKDPAFHFTEFDHELTPFMFFEDSETVMVTDTITGAVHISRDAGAKWEQVKEIKDAAQIFLSPASNKYAIVLCRVDTHWITKDQGKTWKDFTPPKASRPSTETIPLSFHSTNKDKIIFNTIAGRTPEAIYTTDGFESEPKKVRDGAVQCIWAKEKPQFAANNKDVPDDRTLCIVHGPRSSDSHSQRLLVSDKLFRSEKDETWPDFEDGRPLEGVINMASATKYILSARKSERSTEMAMYSTMNGLTWHRAYFGQQKLESDGFTVLESTNYSVQVDVMQGGGRGIFRSPPMGKLYTSNSNGTYFTENEAFTNRNERGFTDFEKLENVQGVVMTNIVTNAEKVLEFEDFKKKASRISFDDGRTFKPLKAVPKDGDKKQELQVHSYTEMRNQGKVFSSKAPGIMMSVGNTGDELLPYDQGDLYVSTNGGIDWHWALDGAHKYEIGDSGAVLFAVYDEAPGQRVLYSLRFGKGGTWRDFYPKNEDGKEKFEKFRAGLLTTIPDSTSKKFVMSASTGEGKKLKHWVFAFDFNALDDVKKCKKDDFETWHARAAENDDKGQCIMGHEQKFSRRKENSVCFVDDLFDEPLPDDSDNCDCSDIDYECDYDFMRTKDGTCEPVASFKPPKGACDKKQETYEGPSGYRKIPGNTCKEPRNGKKKDDPIDRPCNGTAGQEPVDGELRLEYTEFRDILGFLDYQYLERDENKQETVVALDSNNEIWLTHDHGKEWAKEKLKHEVLGIIPDRFRKEHVYFITPSKTVYYSKNWGESIKEFEAPGGPNNADLAIIQFHAKNEDWLLWTTCEAWGPDRCDPVAYVSFKGGHKDTWEHVLSDVGNCEFTYQDGLQGRDTNEKRIFCAHYDSKKVKRLLRSDDLFKEHKDVVKDSIVRYATMSEFIIVATRDEEDTSNLKVDSSIDSETFAPARFPPRMNVTHHNSYTALDSSTHSIFLHATVNGGMDTAYGSIIKSNSNGTSFVMSLEHVNRDNRGLVDFEKLLGVEGAAVANIVANVDRVDQRAPKKKKTMITHNDGADWALITPPEEDADGKRYSCIGKDKEACSLHLHGYTERKHPQDGYSSPTAVGVMLGIGNVGEFLGPVNEGDTFVSNDGGITWKTALQGQYMWEIGDQGSIIVLVKGDTSTDRFFFSLDEGETWREQHLEEEFEISDITTVPSDSSQNFLLWGRTLHSSPRALTINIDFSGLRKRKCKLSKEEDDDNDYWLWTPEHPMQEGKNADCLFGHKSRYWRKKRERNCFNGPLPDQLHDTPQNCTCTPTDFEW